MKNNIRKCGNNKIIKLSNKLSPVIKISTQRYIGKREDKDIFYDFLAWIGSLLVLSTYIFNLEKTGLKGFCFNTLGTFILIVICYDRAEYRVFIINFVLFWGTIYEFVGYHLGNIL